MSFKYETLARLLREKALRLPSGSRLPSVRSLMLTHKVSIQTVGLAVKVLEAEGIISSRHGSGLYVSENILKLRTILFHVGSYPSPNLIAKQLSLERAVQSAGWQFKIQGHDVMRIKERLPEIPVASAHIINANAINIHSSLINSILEQKVPTLILGRESGPLNVDYITSNDFQLLNYIIKHLRDLGHRHLALLINEPEFFEIEKRKQLFAEILELLDLPPAIFIPTGVAAGENSAQAAYTGLRKYLLSRRSRLPFTALVCASAEGGIGALRAFHEAGVKVPANCSLACFGLDPNNSLCVPSITGAGTSVADWGTGAVRMLQQRFKGDKSPCLGVQLPSSLSVQESTAPPPRPGIRRAPVPQKRRIQKF